jgi:uncharacterized protein YecT (DUF1311 family)
MTPIVGTEDDANAKGTEAFQQADKVLNTVYKDLMAKLPTTMQSKLKEAQTAWLRYRDLSSELRAMQLGGPEQTKPSGKGFMAELTWERVEHLRAMIEDISNSASRTPTSDESSSTNAATLRSSERVFTSYREVFRFIRDEGYSIPRDDKTLFDLAAQSSMERAWLDESVPKGKREMILVVSPSFHEGEFETLRGATGFGTWYLFRFRPDDPAPVFTYAGTMQGTSLREIRQVNFKVQFVISGSLSATEGFDSIYEWDGKLFRVTKETRYGGEK